MWEKVLQQAMNYSTGGTCTTGILQVHVPGCTCARVLYTIVLPVLFWPISNLNSILKTWPNLKIVDFNIRFPEHLTLEEQDSIGAGCWRRNLESKK